MPPEVAAMSRHQDFDASITAAMRSFHARGGRELIVEDMPFDEILSAESDGEEGEAGEYERAQRRAAIRAIFRYLTAEGPHPLKIMKRLYAIGRGLNIPPFCELTMEEAGLMFGETKAAHSFRVGLLSGVIERSGMHGSRLPGQKSRSASLSYSRAQEGNRNRKKGSATEQSHRIPAK
jgi:hypothetical protein